MNVWDHVIRTFGMYFIVFLIIRLMGKREIGKLSVLDVVIYIMVAEIAVIVIEDTERPFLDGVIPMVVLCVVQVGLALITLKSRKLRLWFDGKPTMLIDQGKLNKEAMRKQRYNLDDLMVQLRENKVSTVADVEFAILEPSGKLSVITKEEEKAKEDDLDGRGASDLKINPAHLRTKPFPNNFRFESLPVPLIMDGKLEESNLQSIGKDRFWLNNQLKQHGVSDIRKVFLCTIDHKGRLFIDSSRRPRT